MLGKLLEKVPYKNLQEQHADGYKAVCELLNRAERQGSFDGDEICALYDIKAIYGDPTKPAPTGVMHVKGG